MVASVSLGLSPSTETCNAAVADIVSFVENVLAEKLSSNDLAKAWDECKIDDRIGFLGALSRPAAASVLAAINGAFAHHWDAVITKLDANIVRNPAHGPDYWASQLLACFLRYIHVRERFSLMASPLGAVLHSTVALDDHHAAFAAAVRKNSNVLKLVSAFLEDRMNSARNFVLDSVKRSSSTDTTSVSSDASPHTRSKKKRPAPQSESSHTQASKRPSTSAPTAASSQGRSPPMTLLDRPLYNGTPVGDALWETARGQIHTFINGDANFRVMLDFTAFLRIVDPLLFASAVHESIRRSTRRFVQDMALRQSTARDALPLVDTVSVLLFTEDAWADVLGPHVARSCQLELLSELVDHNASLWVNYFNTHLPALLEKANLALYDSTEPLLRTLWLVQRNHELHRLFVHYVTQEFCARGIRVFVAVPSAITDLVTLRRDFARVFVHDNMSSNSDISSALDAAQSKIVNHGVLVPATDACIPSSYFLAAYVHEVLSLSYFCDDANETPHRNDAQDTSYSSLRNALHHAFQCFVFLLDKDLFEQYYKVGLAHRLLLSRSPGNPLERYFIDLVKPDCSPKFAEHTLTMYSDLVESTFIMYTHEGRLPEAAASTANIPRLSKDTTPHASHHRFTLDESLLPMGGLRFQPKQRVHADSAPASLVPPHNAKPSVILPPLQDTFFDAVILSKGHWPDVESDAPIDLTLPEELERARARFEDMLLANNPSCRFDWDHHLGTLQVDVAFAHGRRDLLLTMHQYLVLQCFPDDSPVARDELLLRTNFAAPFLGAVLASLCAPHAILVSTSSDSYVFNSDLDVSSVPPETPLAVGYPGLFTKNYDDFARGPRIGADSKVVHGVLIDRDQRLEAHVMRAFKAHRELPLAHVASHVSPVAVGFNPTPEDFKRTCDALVSRDFLSSDGDTYKYLD